MGRTLFEEKQTWLPHVPLLGKPSSWFSYTPLPKTFPKKELGTIRGQCKQRTAFFVLRTGKTLMHTDFECGTDLSDTSCTAGKEIGKSDKSCRGRCPGRPTKTIPAPSLLGAGCAYFDSGVGQGISPSCFSKSLIA